MFLWANMNFFGEIIRNRQTRRAGTQPRSYPFALQREMSRAPRAKRDYPFPPLRGYGLTCRASCNQMRAGRALPLGMIRLTRNRTLRLGILLEGSSQTWYARFMPKPPYWATSRMCAILSSSSALPSPVTEETANTFPSPSPYPFATARTRSFTFMRESLSLFVAMTVNGMA